MVQAVTYCILDSGNLVRSFDREDEAYHAMERLAHEGGPDVADRLLLVAYDAEGNFVGDCAPGERIAQPV